jgi:hypothetical protein
MSSAIRKAGEPVPTQVAIRKANILLRALCLSFVGAALGTACGCKSAISTSPSPSPAATKSAATYPARPAIMPPAFKVFHRDDATFTLVLPEATTDAGIIALIYELRDASQRHAFAKIGFTAGDEKAIDKRDPFARFHLYRGSKCAAEKYAPGEPPCGASYHAAGDYTLGTFNNPQWDSAELLHNTNTQGDGAETSLWNSEQK